jgi:hypothetical protein
MELDGNVHNTYSDNILLKYGISSVKTDKECYVCLMSESKWHSYILPCGHTCHSRCYAAYCGMKKSYVYSCPVCGDFDPNDKNLYVCKCCYKRGHPIQKCIRLKILSSPFLIDHSFGDEAWEIGLPEDDKRCNPCSDFKCKGYLTFKKNDKFYKCNKCNLTEEI